MGNQFVDTTDCIKKYFDDIDKYTLLTETEELDLAKRIQNGDESAIPLLVRGNLKFVISIAKKYQNKGIPLIDLIGDGNEGLIIAARKFDHTKGFKFISYAVWWVKHSIRQALNDTSRLVRLPVNQITKISTARKAAMSINLVSIEDESVLNDKLSEFHYTTSSSLNRNVSCNDDDDDELINLLADNNELHDNLISEEDKRLKDGIVNLLGVLSSREQDIIKCYFGIDTNCGPMTLKVIGDKYGLTKERIRQIKNRALRQLRSNVYDFIIKE